MAFDASAYGLKVGEILALDGAGERAIPLTRGACLSEAARTEIQLAGTRTLFPESHAPEAATAGLYLYFGCWDEAHEIAQAVSSPEGAYWHAIVHRQEPDDWNSGYWFRQVGRHPIFSQLGKQWDPVAFIDLCSQARQQPGSDLERRVLATQLTEWQLLFDFCAAKKAPR